MDNPVLQAIDQRRSVRSYLPEPLPREILEAIIHAGRRAPSGGNNQHCHFLVLQDREILAGLTALVEQEFAAMETDANGYKSLNHSILAAKKGGYDFRLSAPCLVVVCNARGYGNAMADSAVAIENMMLAATSLQVGSCWINQLRWLRDRPAVRSTLEQLGMAPEETVFGGMALGYARKESSGQPALSGNLVTWHVSAHTPPAGR